MTGLSRNTIAKWLKAPLDGEPKYRRSEQPGKLTAFHVVLKQALKADAHRQGACTDLCTPASPVSDGGRGLKRELGGVQICIATHRPSVMAGVD